MTTAQCLVVGGALLIAIIGLFVWSYFLSRFLERVVANAKKPKKTVWDEMADDFWEAYWKSKEKHDPDPPNFPWEQ